MKVIVIIPAYNEVCSLPRLLKEFHQYRDQYDVVVVDDASTDQTAQVVKSYGVPLLRLPANLGIGGAGLCRSCRDGRQIWGYKEG